MEALMDMAIDASIFFSYTNSAKLRLKCTLFHILIVPQRQPKSNDKIQYF